MAWVHLSLVLTLCAFGCDKGDQLDVYDSEPDAAARLEATAQETKKESPPRADNPAKKAFEPATHSCNHADGFRFEERRFESASDADADSDGDANHAIHLVGIHEAGQEYGDFALHVREPGRVSLVVNSYEAVHWTITSEPQTEIVRIVASGYEAQTVTAPAGVPIELVVRREHQKGLSGVHRWPDRESDCTDAMPESFCNDFAQVWQNDILHDAEAIDAVSARLALPVAAFYGCYDMESLTI